MSEQVDLIQAPRSFWIVAMVSLIWNLIGVLNYLYSVTISTETLAAMSEAERALYTDIPLFVTACFATAVFAGVLGSVLMLLRRALSVSFFLISLVAIVLQIAFGLLLTPMLEVQGATALALPVVIVTCAALLLWYSRRVTALGLLR